MVNNNKILTVSYGTFSCTLEGFDDSFGTMKAIAEYFRDLASDDRYFGAEPPQVDADMLARIAQREVTRRVEAHSENGGIVLRAHDQAEAPAALAPTAAPLVAQVVAAEAATETTSAEVSENVAEPVPAVDVAENNAENSVEQKAEAVEEPAAKDEAEFVADIEVQKVVEAVAESEAFGVRTDNVETITIAEHDAQADTEVADTPLASQQEVVTPDADNDSIAAKLQRIRAVVSRSDNIVEGNGYLEDELAADLVAESEDSIASAFSAEMSDATEAEEPHSNNPEEAFDVDAEEEDYDNLFAEDTSAEATNGEAAASESEVAATDARLIKVNRAALEAAIAEDVFEEDEDNSAEAGEESSMLGASLSDEDEAELQRELAEVGVIPEAADDVVEAANLDDNQDDDEEHPGAKLLTETTNADDDLSRLMAKADSQMDEPESSLRRDAFSHLRAAVAATKAEETLRSDDDNGNSAEAYRDDLASVVKPRRPEPTGVRTQRPAEARPAPLKLVAEQRIDTDGSEARGPVRPRRVASDILQNGSATIQEDAGGFVEFASNAGATQLPELLEAAASYMAFVEGREQFSRPQLMHKVRQVEMQNFSREDGLRSFGKLLRAGKIEKIRGGRFTVSGDIGFKPGSDDTRAAG